MNSDEALDQKPSTELAMMAGALGEALMAAELPAIVSHKRRATVLGGSNDEDMPPGEILSSLSA